MKAPAQLSHHEANPRHEKWIGESQPSFELDISTKRRFSTRSVFKPRDVLSQAIEKSLRKHLEVSIVFKESWYHGLLCESNRMNTHI